jgi:hypothetical protein
MLVSVVTIGGATDALARALVLAIAIPGSLVHADPAATTPPQGVAPATRPQRSPALASSLSVVPTLAGTGLVIAGLVIANRPQECSGDPSVPPYVTCIDHFPAGFRMTVIGGALLAVGPSLGHLYNRRAWTTGLKIRCVGAGIAALGIGVAMIPSECGKFVCGPQALGALAMIGGGATFGVGAFHDAATAYGATHDRNLQLTIAWLRTPRGTAPGFVLQTLF